jgi:hypothetical protein
LTDLRERVDIDAALPLGFVKEKSCMGRRGRPGSKAGDLTSRPIFGLRCTAPG